ncbi:cob(I)yrinic acid a,c-diamide adenosyltransferase [Candidatus Uhrbacteria bacterium CG10_big_fil_rev_8_21_14_0_10_48_11]|uniref:Cob(I)yrinic acid a,c-diamide adenosyltransferase n=1 Tax=Candidatus Uhrbacteria bacterium CG10_big_fil_rev_8_21_14_0_10_48_11 TaxID=1975037 RepID=A0A2M8LE70_9BACT|nr:MAG: cob(I)yrinic acid a,c-diamide adenosyltransferase [Candidatus Uhrbacteria bacterium CG10_big_fil_rev_8_21_14_0_10_48_11]
MQKKYPSTPPVAIPKKHGLFIIYEGKGKGKTTAVMGMAARALGTGFNVYIIQFIKGEWPNGEQDFFRTYAKLLKHHKGKPRLGTIELVVSGSGFVKILGDKKPFTAHKAAARQAVLLAKRAIRSKKYDLVIMDEAISAIESKLITTKDLLSVVKLKPKLLHLAMTGHFAPKALVSKADLVSRIDVVKHPYYKGILAQKGIDF